jgi:SAM-dependent methyltransferase
VGCGTGKLLRKIIRTNATMQALENGPREMRILGVDSNSEALRAAAAKRNLLFNHHGKLPPSLRMEFMLLDLRDLQALDLSNTCIEKSRVDLVLASDIFRWLPESERAGVLGAIRTKVASGGHLISFEFTEPPLPITEDLPKNLALRLATFGFLEPFHIGRFYQQLEDSGFERIPETKRNGHDEEHDRFPQLVSCVFRPAQRKTGK